MAIRKRNDFILSILSFAIGLFLFASESTVSGVMLFVGLPFLAEPRTFIQCPRISESRDYPNPIPGGIIVPDKYGSCCIGRQWPSGKNCG